MREKPVESLSLKVFGPTGQKHISQEQRPGIAAIRAKGPTVQIAQAIGPGRLPQQPKGLNGRPFAMKSNGRSFGPRYTLEIANLGRWPRLSDCLGLWPGIATFRIPSMHLETLLHDNQI